MNTEAKVGHRYYIKQSSDGLFELRQSRFKGQKKEHPHDVCAVALSLTQLEEMCTNHGITDCDFTKAESR